MGEKLHLDVRWVARKGCALLGGGLVLLLLAGCMLFVVATSQASHCEAFRLAGQVSSTCYFRESEDVRLYSEAGRTTGFLVARHDGTGIPDVFFALNYSLRDRRLRFIVNNYRWQAQFGEAGTEAVHP